MDRLKDLRQRLLTPLTRLKKEKNPNQQKAPGKVQRQRQDKGHVRIRIGNPLHSVGMKLFMIFFVCIVLLVFGVGLFSYNEARSIIQNKITDATRLTIDQAADRTELVFRNIEDISLQLMIDTEMQKNLTGLADPNLGDYDKLTYTRAISQTLQRLSMGKSGISNLFILGLKPGMTNIASTGSITTDISQKPWVEAIKKGDGTAVWLPTQKKTFVTDEDKTVFALGRLLKSTTTQSADFILVLEMPVKFLTDLYAKMQIGDSGAVELQTDDTQLVYTPNADKMGQKSDISVEKANKDASVDKAGSTNLNNAAGKQMLVVYKKMNANGWTLLASAPVAELVKDAGNIFQVTLYAAIVAMIVAGLAGFFMARMIGTPIGKLRNLMQQGAGGNLTVRTKFASKDEIGQLGDSFNSMMEQITLLVHQTNQSAADVLSTAETLLNASKKTAGSAKEIATATEEIANGASSLAVEAERGNLLTQEIGDQMQQVIKSNLKMGTSAAEVQRASEQGTSNMSELSSKTASTEQMTRSMVEKVDKLKDSTSSIRKILDVLNNISKQTNILSLNATIEAARAGTAGKGFMVVADEIRKLAEQSKQSIGVVGDITDSIQKEIDETVSVLSDAYPVFQEQIHSVKEAEQIFEQVQVQMGDFVDQLSEVTESIQQLDNSQKTLTEAMSNVSAVSEESSATSEEVASLSNEQLSISESLVILSEELEKLSNSLQLTLSKFQI